METSDNHDGQLRAMALIASLRTAVDVCRAIALRRAGHDPSEQEDSAPVRRNLTETPRELLEAVRHLRLSLAVLPSGESELLRAFEDRLALAEAARSLHLVHQRLLSLYPEVDAHLVERARVMQAEAARLAATESDFQDALSAWCEAALAFAGSLGEALSTAN